MVDKFERVQATEQQTLLQIQTIQKELENLYALTQDLQQRIVTRQLAVPDSELELLLGYDRDS